MTRLLSRVEVRGLALFFGVLVVGSWIAPTFWQPHNLLFDSGEYVEYGLLALPMTALIILGEIDLSVGSSAALCGALLASLYRHGVALPIGMIAAVALGAVLGLVNGLLVTALRLPSLVVTIATLAAFRGLAGVVMGADTVVFHAPWFGSFDKVGFTGGQYDVPALIVAFIAVAALFTVVMHRSVFGRLCFLIGSNRSAAAYSGIRVDKVRLLAFVLTGTMAGVVGILYASRVNSISHDGMGGYELVVITIVVLGGTDIFGGNGSIPATVIATFSVGALRQAMTDRYTQGFTQDAVIGTILIASILLPHVLSAALRTLPTLRRPSATRDRPSVAATAAPTPVSVNRSGGSE